MQEDFLDPDQGQHSTWMSFSPPRLVSGSGVIVYIKKKKKLRWWYNRYPSYCNSSGAIPFIWRKNCFLNFTSKLMVGSREARGSLLRDIQGKGPRWQSQATSEKLSTPNQTPQWEGLVLELEPGRDRVFPTLEMFNTWLEQPWDCNAALELALVWTGGWITWPTE